MYYVNQTIRVNINIYANNNYFFASSDACVRQTLRMSCDAGAPGIMYLTITMLTYVSTLLASAVRTMHAFLRALSVMDLSVILFTSSSPLVITSLKGLSKFTRVAFSNATGFLMYSVLAPEVMLGALRWKSLQSCCSYKFSVIINGTDK